MSYKSLAGKVALITGASTGIGRACAIGLAAQGCFVSITAIAGDPLGDLDEVLQHCIDKGIPLEKALKTEGDLTKEEDCKRIVSTTYDHFKQLDILVNCTGILRFEKIADTSIETFDLIMNTNVRSMFLMSKLCLPHLASSRGNIVNISSVTAHMSCEGLGIYSVSKTATDRLTTNLALESGPQGIRVNAVCPAFTKTKLQTRGGMNQEEIKKMEDTELNFSPLGRLAEPEDIARVVVFLASDEASYITGALLPADGGRLLCFGKA